STRRARRATTAEGAGGDCAFRHRRSASVGGARQRGGQLADRANERGQRAQTVGTDEVRRAMSEDKKAAQKLANEDLPESVKLARDLGIRQQVFSYEHGIPKDLPPGDGEEMMIPFVIGTRGSLTKTDARKAGAMWRKLTAHYPKAIYYLNLLGYDQ